MSLLDVIKKLQERFACHAVAERFDVKAMRVEAAKENGLKAMREFAEATGAVARKRAWTRLENAAFELVEAERQ